MACSRMLHAPVCNGIHRHALHAGACSSMQWLALGCIGVHWHVLAWIGMQPHAASHTGMHWHPYYCAARVMRQYTSRHAISLHWLSLRGCRSVAAPCSVCWGFDPAAFAKLQKLGGRNNPYHTEPPPRALGYIARRGEVRSKHWGLQGHWI